MTTYRKTMAEALKDVYLGENNLDKMRKASKGAAQTLKMKDGNLKMDSFTASAIMQIYDKINDKNKKTFEKMMKDGKKADIMKLQKFAMSKISSEYVPEEFEEEFELDEKLKYEGKFKKGDTIKSFDFKGKKHRYISGKITGMEMRQGAKVYVIKITNDSGKTSGGRVGSTGYVPMETSMDYDGRIVKEEVELDEGYEGEVKKVLKRARIEGYFSNGILYVERGDGKDAMAALKKAPNIKELPKVREEEVELDEKMTFGTKRIPAAMKKKGMEKIKTKGLNKDKSSAAYIGKKKTEEVELDESKKALKAKSEKSGVSVGILSKVYDRGMAAWKTGHRPGTTPQQWALARVNSFLTGGGARKADNDLWQQAKKQKKEEVEIAEDGHADVPSAVRQCKTVMEDATQILSKLMAMGPEDSLPTWWTNKLAVASNNMNKMRDYLLVSSEMKEELEEALDKDDEATVKRIVGKLKKASQAHAGQAKDLEKAMDEKRHRDVDPADVDTSATDDDIKAADKNIMMQLRKSVSLRGNFPVEFMDKKKVKIPMKIAQAVLNKHNSFRKPMDKEKFQAKVAKSHRDLLTALKEEKETKLGVIHRQLKEK